MDASSSPQRATADLLLPVQNSYVGNRSGRPNQWPLEAAAIFEARPWQGLKALGTSSQVKTF